MTKCFRKTREFIIDTSLEAGKITVELLRVLKSKYDYRALSAISGFPISTLTRYVMGKTAPKGVKAKKLLENLLNNVNITALIMNDLCNSGENLDFSRLLLDPAIIKILGAHVINEFMGMKITSILSIDILSIPLATYLAASTSRILYIVSPEPATVNGGAIPIIFPENENGQARACWLIAKSRGKKESVLAIGSQTPNPYFFNSLVETMYKLNMELGGIFTIMAKEEDLKKMKIPPGVKRSYVILS